MELIRLCKLELDGLTDQFEMGPTKKEEDIFRSVFRISIIMVPCSEEEAIIITLGLIFDLERKVTSSREACLPRETLCT